MPYFRVMPRDPKRRVGALGTSVVLAAAAGGAGLVNPVVGIAGATAAPVVEAAVNFGMEKLAARRARRAGVVIARAAELGAMTPEDLLARAEANPELEDLLLRTVRAAMDSASEEKLILYAVSLAAGTMSDDSSEIAWETLLVRVLDDLDVSHLDMLNRFTMTSLELGLGEGPEFDSVPSSLNAAQIEIVAGDLPNRASLLAVLERHGLIERYTAAGGMSFSIGPPMVHARITDFGSDVHERLLAVGRLIAPNRTR